MLSCNRGFLFYEGMLALLLLTIILITLFPILVQIQYERVSIREEREAMSMIQTKVLTHDPKMTVEEEIVNGRMNSYRYITKNQDDQTRHCLLWEGRNGRDQSWCLSSYNP
ncbi:hypothetical protein [Salipaludibacillus keqinensis]|uniref:hypothetical protein n=1 Tax=Salipaludibacillus keqinensis TaxID=2045207 RepID=UPI001304A533|nr:hypothetical protein [Salipaludibacillus keqinensis]